MKKIRSYQLEFYDNSNLIGAYTVRRGTNQVFDQSILNNESLMDKKSKIGNDLIVETSYKISNIVSPNCMVELE